MKRTILVAVGICATVLGPGCATKKYVQQTVAPVETRVTGTETKNTEQDKQLASQSTEIAELGRGLSRTQEKLSDTDQKVAAANDAAKTADGKAVGAQKAADGAAQAAAGAQSYAENLGRSVDGMNRLKLAKSEIVLFQLNRWTLQEDAKAQLGAFCQAATGVERYMVEVQGFTDKTGAPEANEVLSQRRAQQVARHLANDCKIPLRNMTMLGSGYAQPVADDQTRDGRKQNRRVEVRLFVPEVTSLAQTGSR